MIKIKRIQRDSVTGEPEFSVHIPKEYIPPLMDVGLRTLIMMGMAQYVTVTEDEFKQAVETQAQTIEMGDGEMSPEEEKLWNDFLVSVKPEDLSQA